MHWTVHIDGGPQRVNHAAVAIDNYIYSFGGCCKTGIQFPQNIDVYTLNTDTLRWKPVAYSADSYDAIPFQRYGHTVVAHGFDIYLWGGRTDLQSSNILHRFNTSNFTWSLPRVSGRMPNPSDGHTACVINNYMYIFGGYEGESETFKEGLSRINLTTFVWEEVLTCGSIPTSRDFHTATAVGTRMYIFGGRSYDFGLDHFDGGHYSNKISYLETATMQWVWPKTKGEPPLGRRSHSAFLHNDQLYVICGYNSAVEKHFNDMFRYDLATETWYEVKCPGNGPNPRRRQCCCVVYDRMYLFGGTSPSGNPAVEEYTLDSALQNFIDYSDLYVLDLVSSLYSLCLLKVIQLNIDHSWLPRWIKSEMYYMTTNNNIDSDSSFFTENSF